LKTLIYGGPYSAVEVPSLGITAIAGEPIEVPAEAATALIRQGWQEVKAKKEIAK
jgi:hypothetical protein